MGADNSRRRIGADMLHKGISHRQGGLIPKKTRPLLSRELLHKLKEVKTVEKMKLLTPDQQNEIKWLVRQCDRMKAEYDELAWKASDPGNVPSKTNKVGRPVESSAIRAAYLSSCLDAIKKAYDKTSANYRDAVFAHVAYNKPWPHYAAKKTFERHRRIFLFWVAVYLGRYYEVR